MAGPWDVTTASRAAAKFAEDGYEVAKRIGEDPHGRHMLLLALTGYGAADDVRLATEHGFDQHLLKPVDPDCLARLIMSGASA